MNMFPRRACRRRPDGETFAQRGNILGHGPDGETFGESHLPPRRGNIVVQNVSPSVLTPRRGNIFYLWPRRGNILGQIAQNGKEMFPRRGDTCQDRQECFPVGAVANVSPSGLPATGKHFPQARRGNISAPTPTGKHLFPSPRRGNICTSSTGKHVRGWSAQTTNVSPSGLWTFPRNGTFCHPDGETFSSNCTSCHPDGETFPSNDTFCHPDGETFPQMFPRRGDTPTGKHF